MQKIRAISGAIITGSQTVIDDNPSLTVRSSSLGVSLDKITQPKPIILDRRGRLSAESNYNICQRAETMFWRSDNLAELLAQLVTDYQCYDVLVEAGAGVSGAFMEQELVDELIVYQAPCLLGVKSRAMLDVSLDKLADQYRLQLLSHEMIGTDLKMVFKL